jgi:hypothetical protein
MKYSKIFVIFLHKKLLFEKANLCQNHQDIMLVANLSP